MRLRHTVSGLVFVLSTAMGMTACSGALRYTPVPQIMREADPVIIADINKSQAITLVDVKIEHLGPPDRVNPNLTHYVVWARRNTTLPWQRLGALDYNPAARSGTLKAQMGEVAFEMLMTTEASNQPAEPTTSNTIIVQQVGTAP